MNSSAPYTFSWILCISCHHQQSCDSSFQCISLCLTNLKAFPCTVHLLLSIKCPPWMEWQRLLEFLARCLFLRNVEKLLSSDSSPRHPLIQHWFPLQEGCVEREGGRENHLPWKTWMKLFLLHWLSCSQLITSSVPSFCCFLCDLPSCTATHCLFLYTQSQRHAGTDSLLRSPSFINTEPVFNKYWLEKKVVN